MSIVWIVRILTGVFVLYTNSLFVINLMLPKKLPYYRYVLSTSYIILYVIYQLSTRGVKVHNFLH